MSNQPHVVTVQPMSGVMMVPSLPHFPANWTCPFCHHLITTQVSYEVTTKTHLFALGMCLSCCWICAWIPYVTNSCMAAYHSCPQCGQFIGLSNN